MGYSEVNKISFKANSGQLKNSAKLVTNELKKNAAAKEGVEKLNELSSNLPPLAKVGLIATSPAVAAILYSNVDINNPDKSKSKSPVIEQQSSESQIPEKKKYTPELVMDELLKYCDDNGYDRSRYPFLNEDIKMLDIDNIEQHIENIKTCIDYNISGHIFQRTVENGYFSTKKGSEVFDYLKSIYNGEEHYKLAEILYSLDVANFDIAKERGLFEDINTYEPWKIGELSKYSDKRFSDYLKMKNAGIDYVSENDDINRLLLNFDFGVDPEGLDRRFSAIGNSDKIRETVNFLLDNETVVSEIEKKVKKGGNAISGQPEYSDFYVYNYIHLLNVYENIEKTKLLMSFNETMKPSNENLFKVAMMIALIDEKYIDNIKELFNTKGLSSDDLHNILNIVRLSTSGEQLKLSQELGLYYNLSDLSDEQKNICRQCGIDIDSKFHELKEKFDKKWDIVPVSKEATKRFSGTILANNNPKFAEIIKKADFAKYGKEGIPLKYSREKFITNVKSIIANLPKNEQKEILSHFGITEGENGDYDGLLNITPFESDNKQLQKIADNMKREIEKFTLENEVILPDKDLKEVLDGLLKGFPEFTFYVGKKQHFTHKYSVDIHTLKVLQSAMNSNLYNNLSDIDKNVLKMSIIMHDIGKRGGVPDDIHAYTSTDYALAILDRYPFAKDIKRRVTTTVDNHHWFEKYNNGDTDAFDIAALCRYHGDSDIYKIIAKADLENVSESFHLSCTNTKTNEDFDAYMQDKLEDIDLQRFNVNMYSTLLYADRFVQNGKKFPQKEYFINGEKKKIPILNFNELDDKTQMFQYGYAPGLKLKDLHYMAHFVKDPLVLETALKVLFDPHKRPEFSACFLNAIAQAQTYSEYKYCVIFDYNQPSVVRAQNSNICSGLRKDEAHIRNYYKMKYENNDTVPVKDIIIKELNNSGVAINDFDEYVQLCEYLLKKKSLSQIRSDIIINDKKIDVQTLRRCFSLVNKYMLNVEGGCGNNEVCLDSPIPAALGIAVKDESEIPRWFIVLADKYGLPIEILKSN